MIDDIATAQEFERTRDSYDRTKMSWIRTAASLTTFGFSIYKVFQLESPACTPEGHLFGPREFALILVSIGVVGPQNLIRTNGGSKDGRDDSRRQPTTEAASGSYPQSGGCVRF